MNYFTYLPNRILNNNGIADAASIYFYQSGSTVKISVYSDPLLTVPLANPVVVAAGAEVPNIYWSYSGNIRVRIVSADGSVPYDRDPYNKDTSASITLEQFGGKADYVNSSNRGTDNTAALNGALAAINRYYNENTRWSRVPRIELGLGTYWFSQEIDLKVQAYFYGQGSGTDDRNGGTRFMFPAGTRGITINESNTRAGGSEADTTSARGTILDGITIEAEAATGDAFTGTNYGSNDCGIWMRATAILRNVVVRRFAGNGIQIVAQAGVGGDREGNANSWFMERVMTRDCLGHGVMVALKDANSGVAYAVQVRNSGLCGIWDRDTLGNGWHGCQIDDWGLSTTSTSMRWGCSYGGIRYQLVSTTAGIGATTTPGTDETVWYPFEVGGATTNFPAWSGAGNYVCMLPVLATGQSNASTFINQYVEGGLFAHLGDTASMFIGGQSNWTRQSPGMWRITTQKTALYGPTGFGRYSPFVAGTPAYTRFGEYFETTIGGGSDGTFWRARCQKIDNANYAMRFDDNFDVVMDIDDAGTKLMRISTVMSDRRFGRSANVPHVVSFPNFAMTDPDDQTNSRIMRGGLAAPTTGEHAAGERVWNAAPGPGKPEYWLCVTAGTPGTWIGVNVQPVNFNNLAMGSNTAETVLATFTLPANTLGPKGSVEVDVLASYVSNANTKTLRARLGGIGGFAFWSQAVTTTTVLRGGGRFGNTGVTNVQKAFSGQSYGSNSTGILTGAIDTTVAQDIVITGQQVASGDTLVLEQAIIKIFPGA